MTSDDILKNKEYSSKIEPYDIRKLNLEKFIDSISSLDKVEIMRLTDSYGPPIHESEYEGIIVSEETYKTALKINELRTQKGFNPLVIIVIPLLKDNSDQKISSTSIRKHLN